MKKGFRLRRKTRRRLALVGIVTLAVGLTAFGLFFVRRWQTDARMAGHRERGFAAYAAQDRMKALDEFARFLKSLRNARDAEVLKAYGLTRAKVTEFDGRHQLEAIDVLRRYLALQPEDRATRLETLKLCNRAGLLVEALDQASRLRPADLKQCSAEHVDALMEEARAHLGTRSTDRPRAEAVISRLLELSPGNLQALGMYLAHLDQTQREDQARLWAEGLAAKDPKNADLRLIAALARLGRVSDRTQYDAARASLAEAAGMQLDQPTTPQPITDPNKAHMLLRAFDDLRMFGHSLAVLRASTGIRGEQDLRPLLARRLWSENLDDEVVALTAELDPRALDIDTDLIAFRNLSLKRLGREDQARPLLADLQAREWDHRGRAWYAAIKEVDASKSANPAIFARSLQMVIKEKNPLEPVFQAWLGDALAAVGQGEEARQAWRQAANSPLTPGWSAPLLREAESLLSEGRAEEASEAATKALSLAPNRLLVNVIWLEAHAARLSSGSLGSPQPADLMPRLDELTTSLTQAPTPASAELLQRLLPVRIALLVRGGKESEARKTLETALNADPPPSAETLRRLAAISTAERLGLEQTILDRTSVAHGDSAGTFYAKAAAFAFAGRPEKGLEVLTQAAEKSARNDPEFRAALARYQEFIGHPDALASWISLGDLYTEILQVQTLCLESGVTPQNPAFLERTIERYRKLASASDNERDAREQLARARVLMAHSPGQRERDESVQILSGLIADQRDTPSVRVLLARALMMGDRPDLVRATQQLTEAAKQRPDDAVIAVQLARLYQQSQDYSKAKQSLQKLLRVAPASASGVMEASAMLVEIGETGEAIAAMQVLATRLGSETPAPVLVRLGELLIGQRDFAEAGKVFDRLLASPVLDAESALTAAIFLGARGDQDRAERALTKAKEFVPESARRTLLDARFVLAVQRDASKARALLTQAVEADPTLVDAWTRLVTSHLEARDYAKAEEIASKALQANPTEGRVGVLLAQAKRGDAPLDAESLRPIIEQMARDPSSRGLVPVYEELERLRLEKMLDDPASLKALANKFEGLLAVQVQVIERLSNLDPPDLAGAASLAGAALGRFPASPEPARLASGIYSALGRWEDALSAARAWQQRDVSQPVGADVVIAESLIRLRQPAQASRVLVDRLAAAAKTPEEPLSIAILHTHGRALVAAGRDREARELWRPYLSKSPIFRVQIWLDAVAREIADPAIAQAWLADVTPVIASDVPAEQLALAGSMSTLAVRSPEAERKKLLTEAKSILDRLIASPEQATPAVLEARAASILALGDQAGAEAAFAELVERAGDRPIALANLARFALDRGDLPKAESLAARALKSGPSDRFAIEAMIAILRHNAQGLVRAGRLPEARVVSARAREIFEPVRTSAPMDMGVLGQAALLSQNAGDFAQAEQIYRLMLKQDIAPKMAALLRNNLAYAIVRNPASTTDSLREARSLAEQALKEANVPEVRDTLAWASLRAGDRKAAAELFRELLDKNPANPSATIGLAESLVSGPAINSHVKEAQGLLKAFEDQLAAGKVTSAELVESAETVRKNLKNGH
jgi:tetratricopeptide (TPR) repeat protein